MRPHFAIAALLLCLSPLAAAIPAVAQEAETVSAILNPADPQTASVPLQSVTVTVDGEVRSWAPLEKGTEEAWAAYQAGEFPKAVPAFERLAKLGHPVAEWLMGNIYFFGQGVPRNFVRAREMFEHAAEQGYFPAFAPTAQMHEQGLGTPPDPSKAYLWYNVAAAQLPDSIERTDMIKRRETVADQLTPAQIEAAQKRANKFKPKQVIPPDPEDVDWLNE
jgi:Sel1 repeat